MKRQHARKHPSKTIMAPGELLKPFLEPMPELHSLVETVESIHPKLLDLADHDERVGEMSPGKVAGIPEAIAEHIKVPGHKGRHQGRDTLRRSRLVEEYRAEGLSLYEIAPRLGMTYNQLRAFVSKRRRTPRT